MARGVGRAVWLERTALIAVGALLYGVVQASFFPPDSSPSDPRPERTPANAAGERAAGIDAGHGLAATGEPPDPADDPRAPLRGRGAVAAAPTVEATGTAAAMAEPAVASQAHVQPAVTAGPKPDAARAAPVAPRLHRRPAGVAPDLPLTRMPGANQLRAGSKWDPKRGAWVLTRAYEVPAARGHVAAFYRKAISDQGLEVSRVEGAPDAEGVVPLYLKGRSAGRHANITIRQDPEELRTRVRVIWRAYAEASTRSTAPDPDDGDEA